MKTLSFLVALVFLGPAIATSQETQAQATKPTTITQSLNKSLGVFVFPAKDQSPEQQAKDEQACYEWAVAQSGVDPINMTATKPDSVAVGPDGSAVRGAARGAAAGAVIGAIAGDAGKGAGIGAAAGAMSGTSAKRQKEAKKAADSRKAAAAKDQAAIDGFKKAYSACLEGKGYSVK